MCLLRESDRLLRLFRESERLLLLLLLELDRLRLRFSESDRLFCRLLESDRDRRRSLFACTTTATVSRLGDFDLDLDLWRCFSTLGDGDLSRLLSLGGGVRDRCLALSTPTTATPTPMSGSKFRESLGG